MERTTILQTADRAWGDLSALRKYRVSKDSPVCIFIARLFAKHLPSMSMVIIPIPKADDFQAVLVGEVDGIFCVVDAAHLTWRKRKLTEDPSLEEATLILPIQPDFDPNIHMSNADEFNPEYIEALTKFIHEQASSVG